MGNINQLNECTDPVAGDYLPIADASAAANDRDRRVDVGRFALRETAQSFSATQTFAPGAGAVCIEVNAANHSNHVQQWRIAGSVFARLSAPELTNSTFRLIDWDNGAGVGQTIMIGKNSNSSTPAAGALMLVPKSGTIRRIWVDESGLLRIHTSDITSANDTAGTVVGTQSSHVKFKEALGAPVDGAQALAYIRDAAEDIRRFRYRDGQYNGQEFSGLILDGPMLHRYGMDADQEHPAGKSLNEINAIGDLFLAMRHLDDRLKAIEDRV